MYQVPRCAHGPQCHQWVIQEGGSQMHSAGRDQTCCGVLQNRFLRMQDAVWLAGNHQLHPTLGGVNLHIPFCGYQVAVNALLCSLATVTGWFRHIQLRQGRQSTV
jgi:hypothetical protein